MRARPVLAGLRPGLLLLGLTVNLPGVGESSCQTTLCGESFARHRLESIQRQETEVVHSSDSRVWLQFMEDIQRESSYQRTVAQYEAKFRWETPTILERPEEARAAHQARVATWTERWRARFPGRSEPWCEPARYAPTLAEAMDILAAGERAGADPAEIEDCRSLVRIWRGQRDEALAELEAALERDPRNLRLHDRLVTGLGYGPRTPALDDAILRRAEAFPEDAGAQAAQLRKLVESRRFDEAAQLLDRTSDLSWAPQERLPLCTTYRMPGAIRLPCLEQVLRELDPSDSSEEALWFRETLHNRIRKAAIESGDTRRAVAAIEAMSADQQISAWVETLDPGIQTPEICSAARSFLRDRGARPAPAQLYELRQYLDLLQRMEPCGADDDVRAALAPLDPGGAGDPIATRIARISLHAERTIPHAASGPSPDQRDELAMESAALDLRIPYFLERAAADPTRAKPAVVLARAFDLSGDLGESERWYEEAIRRDSENAADLRIRKVELYLRHGAVEKARQEAQAVQRMPAAFARYRAEADYFLARLARQRGDLEEATDRFEAYFTMRHRYDLCATCDRPLLLQLFEIGDPDRLRRFLAARSDAVDFFERQLTYCGSGPKSNPRACPSSATSAELEAARAGGCSFPATAAHLESLAARPGGPDPALERRARLVKEQPPCPEAWRDSATWFRDDQVLRVYDALIAVD